MHKDKRVFVTCAYYLLVFLNWKQYVNLRFSSIAFVVNSISLNKSLTKRLKISQVLIHKLIPADTSYCIYFRMSSYAFHLKQHSSVFVYSVHRSSRTYSAKHSIPGEEDKRTAHALKKESLLRIWRNFFPHLFLPVIFIMHWWVWIYLRLLPSRLKFSIS